jgi:signal transduction histidine kinase
MSDSNDRRDDAADAAASLHRIWLLAHDLKNSFSLMSYAFHELPRHLAGGENPKQAFTELRTLLTHVDLLASTLLETLRLRTPGRTAVSINDFLSERDGLLRRTLGPGVTLAIRESATDAVVLASVAELERLLFALVSNACIAMPDGGEVTISTTWLDHGAGAEQQRTWPRRFIRITVGDTGDGLDRNLHMRLLEPFPGDIRPLDAERDSVVSAVRRLHGWLVVESEDRVGTRVHVCLPAVPEPPDFDLNRPLPE